MYYNMYCIFIVIVPLLLVLPIDMYEYGHLSFVRVSTVLMLFLLDDGFYSLHALVVHTLSPPHPCWCCKSVKFISHHKSKSIMVTTNLDACL